MLDSPSARQGSSCGVLPGICCAADRAVLAVPLLEAFFGHADEEYVQGLRQRAKTHRWRCLI